MASARYPIMGITVIALIGLVVTLAPSYVEDLSQNTINTSELQDSTGVQNVSSDANVTTDSGVVDQASGLVNVLTNPESGNRLLGLLFTIIVVGTIAWIILAIWIG